MADPQGDLRRNPDFKSSVTVSQVVVKTEDCSRILIYVLVESGKCEAEQINKYLKKIAYAYFVSKMKGKILLSFLS